MENIFTPSVRSLLINGCLIILGLTAFASLLLMVGGDKLFEKAKKNKLSVYFPILNLFFMLEIVEMSSFWGILFFVPVFNLLSLGLMFYRLGVIFNAPNSYKFGLVLFPLCYYPLLAFGDFKYKISDEEYFKALDNAKAENINLLTDEEIKEQNNSVVEEPKENIDSVFKSDMQLKDPVKPYVAQKIDVLNSKPISEEVENPFKPISVVTPPSKIEEENIKSEEKENKFVENDSKENKTEYVDL